MIRRLWPLVPLLALAGVVLLFTSSSGSLVDLIGTSAPAKDEFQIRRVHLDPGEIRIGVTNPQHDELTIGSVTVDDAIVPFELDGPRTLKRLRSSTVVVAYDWVENEPLAVGVTSSSGIETRKEVAAAVETPDASPGSFLGYGLIGLLVGIVPVALGLAWLPSLRASKPSWIAGFMALTGGLLAFLGIEALSEALALQAVLPGPLGGPGLVLLGVAASFLGMSWLSQRMAGTGGTVGGVALATLVAVGIGVHNLGEGLAIGSSFALGELALGSFLIVGFMIHNITEGLGIAAPIADRGIASISRLAALALVAGGPAIVGAWVGGFLTSDFLGVLFFAGAAGAALQVVVEVGRHLVRTAPGGLRSGHVVTGFLTGITVMYATGLLV
jgi:hypothetical protein